MNEEGKQNWRRLEFGGRERGNFTFFSEFNLRSDFRLPQPFSSRGPFSFSA
jgi:hypothetical protein